ncbi:MAG: GGDEF domain-containing protein [Acidimicrobiales bacterium]|nr:GGDEF domain-containing protein [Acidimicrobiales bacterium]
MAVIERLIEELGSNPSGIGFVYSALEKVVEEYGCQDAVLVLESPDYGRQIFRHGRKVVETDCIPRGVIEAEAGLYLIPDQIEDEALDRVVNLCDVALKLDRAKHDATHDSLTSLLNRRSFDEVMDHLCSQSARYGWVFTLVLIDVDEFKAINDTKGHAIGDEVLQMVARSLQMTLRSGDRAARIGGDEFALILANATSQGAIQAVERLRVSINNQSPGVSISTGIASAPDEGEESRELFAVADERLYLEKGSVKH